MEKEEEEYKKIEMRAHEGFIRRASKINSPFMLKGSYITRQYFLNSNDRIPADLDWVYVGKLIDEKTVREVFNNWVTAVTELELNDDIKYRSFRENEFWRRIDYAMADDFPTVNTDLKCWVDGTTLDFGLDISFNLNFEQPPISLVYKPLTGEPFTIPNTVPLSLQVSWKIHQTLVRPRFKDLFDLIYLVQHPTFDEKTLALSFQALLNECSADNVDLNKLKYFLNYNIGKLFPSNSINETWDYWRHNINKGNYSGDILYFDQAKYLTNAEKLPMELSVFIGQFKEALEVKGLTIELIKDLIIPSVEENKKETKQFENFTFGEKEILTPRQEESIQFTAQKMSIWDKVKKIFK